MKLLTVLMFALLRNMHYIDVCSKINYRILCTYVYENYIPTRICSALLRDNVSFYIARVKKSRWQIKFAILINYANAIGVCTLPSTLSTILLVDTSSEAVDN